MAARLHTLSNGIQVAIDADDRTQIAGVGMYFKVGSRFEKPAENGIAHFLEHMAFKGTPTRTARGMAEEIAAMGANQNAFTGREATCYFISGLGKDTDKFIDILSDIVMNPTLPADELEIERGAILQEIKQYQDDPDSMLMEQAHHIAYPGQPYGSTILGPAKNIETLTRAQLDTFRRKHYHAGNLIVSVAGNVDEKEVLKKLEATVGKLPVSPRSAFKKAAYAGGFRHDPQQTAQFRLMLQFPAYKETDPRVPAAQIFSAILGGGMSSRLFHEIREKRGLVYTIQSFTSSSADTGTFGIYAATDEKGVKQLLPVLFDELDKIRTHGVTEQELAAVRAGAAVNVARKAEETMKRMLRNASSLHIYGRLVDPAAAVADVEKVTAQQIKDVANDIFSGKMTLVTRGPGREVEPFAKTATRLAPPAPKK
jgi:predicted Zn-dependent peptidase